MRLLPYAKQLIARRAAGERPWLVVITMGNDADRRLMRMGAFDGDRELAGIWVPDDFRIAGADLHWAVGLDVFVAPFCDVERAGQFLWMLWCARVATLWQLDARFTATRIYSSWRTSGELLTQWTPVRAPLDGKFRALVERTRWLALAAADEPCFQDPLFSSERLKLLAA